jgi:hypothetical protein
MPSLAWLNVGQSIQQQQKSVQRHSPQNVTAENMACAAA